MLNFTVKLSGNLTLPVYRDLEHSVKFPQNRSPSTFILSSSRASAPQLLQSIPLASWNS